MRLRSRQLEDKLTELDLKIGKLPPGSLHVSHNGKYIRWYVAKDGGKSYIPKEKKSFAQLMAQKKYLECLRKDMQFEKKCIDTYLEKSDTYSPRIPQLLKQQNYKDLLTNYSFRQSDHNIRDCGSPAHAAQDSKYREGIFFI